jgi:hypothetical protein
MTEPPNEYTLADRLNRECFCIETDLAALHDALARDLLGRGLPAPLADSHPHLFSTLPVFVARAHILEMQRVIDAIETVVALAPYREAALGAAPAIARQATQTGGVLQGYDFHLTVDGPRLIEINTNAGGAMLNAVLGRAQRACCDPVAALMNGPCDLATVEARLVEMFRTEWRRARGDVALQHIAIIDTAPREQYLYPEFLLFQRLFEGHGIHASVADPSELQLTGGAVRLAGRRVDLIYNRLTDFYFDEPSNALVRDAYRADAVVVSPNPAGHALLANKHNLTRLTDAALLERWGVGAGVIETLTSGIPTTIDVATQDRERLWQRRKQLFFKPACGHGSRGSYRGDKLTRKVFDEIMRGDYVAQALVPPSERISRDTRHAPVLKVDLRNYVYDGETLLVAARLYQGQTTNFRTPGGGFAPVFFPGVEGWCNETPDLPL